MEEQMKRHQKKMLRKQEQEKTRTNTDGGISRHKGHVIWLLVLVALVGAAVYFWKYLKATTPEALYTAAPVHWHAKFEVVLCGEKQDFTPYGAGAQHAGSSLLHSHGDEVIHIEGQIMKKEDIAIGKFFDSIDVPFDRDRIMSKKNGDECPSVTLGAGGKPGQVKMFVNDEPNDEFRNYIPFATEKAEEDRIKIVFE
ncbi:MAG: hypothetical protein Q7S48_02265 [bacterium]|nr:hypothetical protein [bacterium]